ncbi:DUF3152 domain-containing protein [Streptomyces sp. NPDC057413]|uniref:DUF3152 domain-containing protein n=1 Tax=Streptomyces sp. NPDC057413 TaxID=3346124 RepID=UPI003697EE65
MGRHSRRGPAPKKAPGETTQTTGGTGAGTGREAGAGRESAPAPLPHPGPAPRPAPFAQQNPMPTTPRMPGAPQRPAAPQTPGPRAGDGGPGRATPPGRGRAVPPGNDTPRLPDGTPAHGVPRLSDGTPARGVPRLADGTPAYGVPRLPDGTPARAAPRLADGTPARGVPRMADGTPAHGVPRLPDGTPAHGVPRMSDGTPARGVPSLPDGTPARGVPRVRGGHPEQREPGGGWGEWGGAGGAAPARGPGPQSAGVPIPRQRRAPHRGPRQDYLDAFEGLYGDGPGARDDLFTRPGNAPGRSTGPSAEPTAGTLTGAAAPPGAGPQDTGPAADDLPARPRGGKGRTFTGIAAAAVTTVLAIIVAGQVADGHDGGVRAQTGTDQARDVRDSASRGEGRPSPSTSAAPLTYAQKMAQTYPLSATLKGPGTFDAVPGADKAPGKGQKYTYRVDIEQGLGLDGALFAEAVQQTLNDPRSWAHGGARTFERVSSGKPDFVITLASPGTTAAWCAKSGLDTTEDNVSCDSAATERVMINAYRWAQGSPTYGNQIYAYRQMLINHEVGHRLGHGHVTCDKDGQLAPVMQQQTKFLDHDGIHCRPNPWPYPGR